MKNIISINKIILCATLILPIGLLSSCSKEDNSMPPTLGYQTVTIDNINMPSSGLIVSQYSDSPVGYDIRYIVDGDINTCYSTPHDAFYILWTGDKSVAVTNYSLTSASSSPESAPTSWTLYGSTDNSTWVPLDKQANQTFSDNNAKNSYTFVNAKTFKYYKLVVDGNNGGSSTQIAEWTLQGDVANNIDDLMSLSGGDTFDASTPMGNHYANKHVTTDEDKAWLTDAANEPDLLASAPGLHWADFEVTALYPNGDPSPADVNQHAIGDCSALAVFASFAYMYPQFTQSLIKDNGDQTYTVSMFDPQGKKINVTVSSKFLADNNGNIQNVAGKNNQITWATILEKAMMKWEHVYQVNSDIGGIGSEHVAPLFTGNGGSFSFAPGKLTIEQLGRAVNVSMSQGKIVVGGFTQSYIQIGSSIYETVSGHAFTMMTTTKPDAFFSMRNPWGFSPTTGADDNHSDGVLDIVDDGTIPQMIDLRIINPGIAAETSLSPLLPYAPPSW